MSPCLAESLEVSEIVSCPKPDQSHTFYKKKYVTDIQLSVVRKELKLERHAVKGEIVASASSPSRLSPSGSSLTWNAIATLVILAVSYAIPLNRLSKMLKNQFGAFSSGQISKILQKIAALLLVIYLELADQIAEVRTANGDDSPTRVIRMKRDNSDPPDPESLEAKVAARLGRTAVLADGSGLKKRLSISVVAAMSDVQDRRSWIFLFRTHFGDLGNLLSRIFQARSRKNKKIGIQSDLASINNLEPMILALFEITQAGCGSHARRPIWRHRKDDPGFCYFMLRAFAILARIERDLKHRRADAEQTIKTRKRHAAKIWDIIHHRCQQLVGEIPYTGQTTGDHHWPPDSPLAKSARYIIRNYKALTAYLDNGDFFFSNNLCERLLRREKMMLVSSKFRLTERGRVVFDILQTITATCTAASVSLKDYLPFVWNHRTDLEHNPHLYTPLAFAKLHEQSITAKAS